MRVTSVTIADLPGLSAQPRSGPLRARRHTMGSGGIEAKLYTLCAIVATFLDTALD
jgi:hypothetical protein